MMLYKLQKEQTTAVYASVMRYRHIIIPENAFIPQDTQEVLNRFIKNGGRVSDCLSDLSPVIQVEGSGLRAMHRKAENAELFFLFRECGENGDYQVHLPSSSGYLLDLETGNLQRFEAENSVLKLSLAIGETAVILLTDETFDAENKKEFRNKFDIPNGFLFRKEIELICNENGFENIKHSEKSVSVTLDDWSNLIGSAYSASGIYETTFALPADKVGKEGEIALGDVHFAASVYLNDKPLGTALMPPYRMKIPAGVLDKKNKLKVVVTKHISKPVCSHRLL